MDAVTGAKYLDGPVTYDAGHDSAKKFLPSNWHSLPSDDEGESRPLISPSTRSTKYWNNYNKRTSSPDEFYNSLMRNPTSVEHSGPQIFRSAKHPSSPPKSLFVDSDEEDDMVNTSETESAGEPSVLQINDDVQLRLKNLTFNETSQTFPSFPTEIQIEIFELLDPIDACALGLTSQNTYLIFRELFGTKMALTTRRRAAPIGTIDSAWEVVGMQGYPQCGVYRCELRHHIKGFMPECMEYCSVHQQFRKKAEEGAVKACQRKGQTRSMGCHICARHSNGGSLKIHTKQTSKKL